MLKELTIDEVFDILYGSLHECIKEGNVASLKEYRDCVKELFSRGYLDSKALI